MNEEKIKETLPQQQPEEQDVDLIELTQRVWASRKLIYKWCGIAAIAGLIVAFSIPREYKTSVTLALESASKPNSGNVGTLAAMAGINIGNSSMEDALSPELYPDIVRSTPFLTELFSVQVEDINGTYKTTLYDYLKEYQHSPWWHVVFSAPFRAIGWTISLFKKDKPVESEHKLDMFKLTSEEAGIAAALSSRISIISDKKTRVTKISVSMQDPLISAALTDTVMYRLQNFITNYRTNKAKHDLIFTEKLHNEARKDYHVAQKKYADYMDSNQKLAWQSRLTEQERMKNESLLAYNVYSQMAQQLQVAKAKVQEITPVYTVVQPATVPLYAAKPNKIMILIGFVFLAGAGSIGWILFVKGMLKCKKKEKE